MRARIAAVVIGLTTTTGTFTTVGTVSATAVAAKPPSETRVKTLEMEFKNCRRAAAWLSSADEVGKAKAFFSTEMGSPVAGRSAGGRPTISSNVTWKYDSRRSRSTISVPTWPNMSGAEKAAVRRYLDALRAHENGHHRLAREFLSAERATITGKGKTAIRAQADLKARIRDYANNTKQALQDKSDLYDKKTAHGVRQSKIGGEDVRLACPR